jgi:chromosome segregation ATPase
MIDTIIVAGIVSFAVVITMYIIRRPQLKSEAEKADQYAFERLRAELVRRDLQIQSLEDGISRLKDEVNTYISSTNQFRKSLIEEKMARQELEEAVKRESEKRRELTERVRYLEAENERLREYN